MKVSPTIYSVYILTNYNKTVLYIGVTNNLEQRLIEHYLDSKSEFSNKFTARYQAIYLLYHEGYKYINEAIAREKELKKWRREKKDNLINTTNSDWNFLNQELLGEWPPTSTFHRGR